MKRETLFCHRRNQFVENLGPGDEVFWTDPDGGLCSRTYTIRTIEHLEDSAIRIEDKDGSVLECFANELS